MIKKDKEKLSGLKIKGWSRFIHRLFLIITFPIRRPGIFIPLLIILYLTPTFMGAKPNEVHLWYWNKIKNNTSNITGVISEKTQAIKPLVENINISMPSIPSINSFKTPEKPIEQVIDLPQNNSENIRRKMFEKAQGTPEAIDVLKTAQQVDNVSQNYVSAPIVSVPAKTDTKKKLQLIYADQKNEVSGTAKVNNANEIEIDNKTYFLHGIYVDPNTQKGLEAKNYLKILIAENIVHCTVEAYTYQGVGTVRCKVNGEDINRVLVEEGYSKNVALD